ncbi:hypothetical protein GEV33_014406 [Tenebrio molitor]|uniref:NACHT domain-containing protein n=1 Tax=Tenebrio molitor TaxID=7067 RepID=A0A8J6L4T3_TENMO|nr:hypothetical protein GEV33_014406 [Tenebrio molitor]
MADCKKKDAEGPCQIRVAPGLGFLGQGQSGVRVAKMIRWRVGSTTLVKEAFIRRDVRLEFLLDGFPAASVLLHGFASTCCTPPLNTTLTPGTVNYTPLYRFTLSHLGSTSCIALRLLRILSGHLRFDEQYYSSPRAAAILWQGTVTTLLIEKPRVVDSSVLARSSLRLGLMSGLDGGPGEETASLVPGGDTVDGEACSPQNGVVVTFGEIRSFNLLFGLVTPLDPLNGDILRVSQDPPSPTNRFPTSPRNLYNLDGSFTKTSRRRISEDLGPPPLTALNNRSFHRNLTTQPPDLLIRNPGFGAEYEVHVSAYFALKLNNIEDVHNYSIECNDKRLRNFQDVVIHVTKNQTQVSFAILLKYKYADYKFRFSETFGKGVFSLKKYCELFKNLKDVDKQHQFILYTNAKFDPKWAAEVKNFTMIQDDRCDENMFLNTSSSRGNVYRFEVNDKTPQDEKITKSDYEMFFSRFRVFVCQKNVESFEKAMVKILQHNTLLLQYLHLFRKWHQHRFTNTTIDKTTVNIHLTDIFLSQFVTNRHLLVGQDEKLKFFEKVVKEFDITLISDCFENFAENLTEDSGVEEGVDESRKETNKGVPNTSLHQLISFAQKNKMIERSVTTLEPQIKLKVSQYLFQKPIIVHFNETSEELIYNLMKILQLGSKIKFIFVGQGIQSERLSRFRIFENLNDLRNNDELYSEVTRTCRLSLQGRKETTLEELIDSCEEISEHVGAKEILQMLKENFLIGQPADTLPSFYINRKVSFKVKTIDAFLDATFFNKHLAVVKLDKKAKEIQNEFRKRNINVVDVNDYLNSTQISNEPTIISTNEECSKQLLQLKSNNKTVVYLKISEDNGFLIISIEENQIRCLNRPVNILCADLGMGKTTMINKLRNEFDFSFWTIHVELRAHDKFFKTKHDANELLNHFIESNENNFSKHIRDVYLSKKKIYFFFDGLDEVEESCIENILYFIKTLSSKGFYVWIASRKNLKMQLEKHFELVAMDMEEVEEDQQKLYIENRLKKEYNHEQIENLLSKISNGSDVDNNCQVLGKAFQLYNITQIFLDDKKLLKQVTERSFIFTKMYEMFFRGRFKHNLDKAVPKNLHLSLAEEEDILEKHELLAVHCVFGEEIFKKLNLDLRLVRRFLNHIKWYKDPLDIVTKVNVEGKAVFKHFTYGEYFAARFFANNFAKARLIREELFSDRHKNLMMVLNVILAEDNPLHLAVIFRNVNKMEKYIQDKNIYDKAGRNPLHLATFNEPRCVDPKPCLIGVSIETREYYLTNICILKNMMKFNYADCDNLFEWSALQYAFENNSFVCVEMIQNTYEYSNKELHQHTKNVIRLTLLRSSLVPGEILLQTCHLTPIHQKSEDQVDAIVLKNQQCCFNLPNCPSKENELPNFLYRNPEPKEPEDTVDANDTEKLLSPERRRGRLGSLAGNQKLKRRFNCKFATSRTGNGTALSPTFYSSFISANMASTEYFVARVNWICTSWTFGTAPVRRAPPHTLAELIH